MTARAYLRYSPSTFHDKVVVDRYPPGAYAAFSAMLCLAEEQPERGRFRSEKLLRLMLDEPQDGVRIGWGKWVRYLVDHGDLVRQPGGSLYVVGWDEWQEGDVTVAERMSVIRGRRGEPPPDRSPGAARTANWRLRKQVFERDEFTCRYCGDASYERDWLVLEHVVPEPVGPTTLDNLVAACRPCNKRKGNRTPEEAGMSLLPVTRHIGADSDGSQETSQPSRATQREPARATTRGHSAEAGSGSGGNGGSGSKGYTQPKTPRPPNGSGNPANEPRLTPQQLASWADFERTEWDPFKAAWMGRGLLWAPGGSPEDGDDTQRGLLWSIAANRPNDLGQWVREAKGKTAKEVIGHVLDRWHDIRRDVAEEEDEAVAEQAARRQSPTGGLTRIGTAR